MGAQKKSKEVKQLSKSQYEELGRIVASVYETGYLDKAKSYKMTFIKGLLQGLGGVIGATVLVALLLWILSFFDSLPLLDNIIHRIQDTIQSSET